MNESAVKSSGQSYSLASLSMKLINDSRMSKSATNYYPPIDENEKSFSDFIGDSATSRSVESSSKIECLKNIESHSDPRSSSNRCILLSDQDENYRRKELTSKSSPNRNIPGNKFVDVLKEAEIVRLFPNIEMPPVRIPIDSPAKELRISRITNRNTFIKKKKSTQELFENMNENLTEEQGDKSNTNSTLKNYKKGRQISLLFGCF